jgi:prevent-host-death family protein
VTITVNIHAAKTQLSRLLEQVEDGEEIVIARAGKPIARIVPLVTSRPKRKLGILEGQYTVADNIDDPLPDDLLEEFYNPL